MKFVGVKGFRTITSKTSIDTVSAELWDTIPPHGQRRIPESRLAGEPEERSMQTHNRVYPESIWSQKAMSPPPIINTTSRIEARDCR